MTATNYTIHGACGGQFDKNDRCVACGSDAGYCSVNGRFQKFCPVCDEEFIDHDHDLGNGRGEDEPL